MKHDLSLTALRGVAIILVVAFHSVEYLNPDGPIVNRDDWVEYLAFTFRYLRMPLFTVLSGFVYAFKPAQAGSFDSFLYGKGRRILLPLFSVSTLTYLLMYFSPGVIPPYPLDEMWKIYIFRFNQWWFLHSIIIIFLVVGLIDYFGQMQTPKRWLAWLFVTALLSYLTESNRLSISGSTYLLPYFILGCGIKRFCESNLKTTLSTRIVAFVFIAGIVIQQLVWFEWLDTAINKRSLLGLTVGLTGTFTLVYYRVKLPFLTTLGSYSYSIYLFHMFGLAVATRVVSVFTDSPEANLLFIVKFFCALLLPIPAEMAIKRLRLLRLPLLGIR